MPFGLPDQESKLSYGGYLRVAELTALQSLRSDPVQHDEMLFIVIHQVYELWFKQLLHELDAVVRHLDADRVLEATRLLRRVVEIQEVLVAQLAVLETMTPMDFLAFRDHLMPASGFQSAQFRELEFRSGLKDRRVLDHYPPDSPDRARLEQRLTNPSLRDAFYALLARRGIQLPAEHEGMGEQYRARVHEARLEQLQRIYRDAQRFYDLFLLAEGLISYDEMFALWRMRHVQMVERVIGGRVGTGGSDGAAYLRTTVDRHFFPELWELRSYLSARGAPSAD